jgi:RNA polymerase sigma-70 factor (ECF subfamily)
MESARVRDRLNNYYLYHAARADLLRRLNRPQEATAAYELALSLTTNAIEQNYLRRRLAETGHSQYHPR